MNITTYKIGEINVIDETGGLVTVEVSKTQQYKVLVNNAAILTPCSDIEKCHTVFFDITSLKFTKIDQAIEIEETDLSNKTQKYFVDLTTKINNKFFLILNFLPQEFELKFAQETFDKWYSSRPDIKVEYAAFNKNGLLVIANKRDQKLYTYFALPQKEKMTLLGIKQEDFTAKETDSESIFESSYLKKMLKVTIIYLKNEKLSSIYINHTLAKKLTFNS